jgi:hypothetical protein
VTAFETTRRDLQVIKGWEFVPKSWGEIAVGDVVLGADAQTRYVVAIERHWATAIVTVMHGNERQSAEKNLADAVHVLDDATGVRSSEHAGFPLSRNRKTS